MLLEGGASGGRFRPRVRSVLEANGVVVEYVICICSDVQRLGWLLDRIEQAELARALAQALAGTRLLPTQLTPARDDSGARLDPRWQVLVNDNVEPDL